MTKTPLCSTRFRAQNIGRLFLSLGHSSFEFVRAFCSISVKGKPGLLLFFPGIGLRSGGQSQKNGYESEIDEEA